MHPGNELASLCYAHNTSEGKINGSMGIAGALVFTKVSEWIQRKWPSPAHPATRAWHFSSSEFLNLGTIDISDEMIFLGGGGGSGGLPCALQDSIAPDLSPLDGPSTSPVWQPQMSPGKKPFFQNHFSNILPVLYFSFWSLWVLNQF